jgi:CubicO group peptidase (beta-lactamase class C family)
MAHGTVLRFTMKISHTFVLCGLVFWAAGIPKSFAQTSADPRVVRVFQGLRPPIAIQGRPAVRWAIAERMAANHVPGISIAIIDGSRLVWAGAFGVREADARDSVTTSTLFEAQSISKAIAATATLVLADSGKLSLDAEVNTYLKSWKLPDNEFQRREKVTLRRILSHSAGLNVGSFDGYRSGEPIPSLLQILNGEKPHGGSIWGFRALLVMFPAIGKGAVVMANADRADALIDELIMSIAAEYQWPARTQSERAVVTLAPMQLEGLVGTFSLPPAPSGTPVYFEISRDGGQLLGELKGLGSYPKVELYPASALSFFTDSGLSFVFARDASGRAVKMKMGEIEGSRK